jgi:hypothetical protein
MTVTIYRSTDAGAPALPANANYVKASFFMDIIKQCLVTGYGSKAGAGWSVAYEDTTANKRRIAVSNGNGVMEFITWGTDSIAMVMWDSITTPGAGRLYSDSFATVMSVGVNGWKSQQIPAAGVASDNIAGINFTQVHSGNSANIAWTVFADDKSVWVLFHYPAGNSNAEGADSLGTNSSYHPQLFFGALKSPDLTRNQAGNLFLISPSRNPASSSSSSTGGLNSLSYFWGLRTPHNTVPSVANNSRFLLSFWSGAGIDIANSYSSVRVLIPAVISYIGLDVVKPASLTTSNGYYLFATIPGLAQFGISSGFSTIANYWLSLNIERGAAWNMQTYTVNGVDWMPWNLSGDQSTLGNYGITDDAGWWS